MQKLLETFADSEHCLKLLFRKQNKNTEKLLVNINCKFEIFT